MSDPLLNWLLVMETMNRSVKATHVLDAIYGDHYAFINNKNIINIMSKNNNKDNNSRVLSYMH